MKYCMLIGVVLFSESLLANEVRPYELEMLIFSRAVPSHSIDEIFPATQPDAPKSFSFDFALKTGFKNLEWLPRSGHELKNASLRIETQMNGQILFHERWIHPLSKKTSETPWFEIRGQGRRGETLTGFMQWSINRYIELNADFRVMRDGVRFDQNGKAIPDIYVLKEFRKLSSKDIHYLDHPSFGVIIVSEMIEKLRPETRNLTANEASESETQSQPQLQR